MQILEKAVTILRQGGLVAFPTETVYGLGADARSLPAIRKIFIAKQRPSDHPLIVHLAHIDQLSNWARDIPPLAFQLAQAFWPGPMTLVLKKAASVLNEITGHQDTVGIRIPSHPLAQALLHAFGSGIVAPSANRFGRISPTTASAVEEELGDQVELILDGGQCEVGVESTIIDVSHNEAVILRPGMITREQISQVLQRPLADPTQRTTPRVSGALPSHYAPLTPTHLIERSAILPFLNNLSSIDFPLALIVRHPLTVSASDIHQHCMPTTPHAYAHALYQSLRTLDKQNFRHIIIENLPENLDWEAIRDRVKRAAY